MTPDETLAKELDAKFEAAREERRYWRAIMRQVVMQHLLLRDVYLPGDEEIEVKVTIPKEGRMFTVLLLTLADLIEANVDMVLRATKETEVPKI